MLDAEVVVVGGGPGGSALALALARAGRRVLVLDRAAFPREKVCGEGLMPQGVAALQALVNGAPGFVEALRPQPFPGVAYHVPGASAIGRFPNGLQGWGVRRLRLDQGLAGLCAQAGVERRQARAQGLGGGPGAMWVDTDRGRVRARVVVGADGMHSGVRRALGLQRPAQGRPRYGARGHVQPAPGARPVERVEVHALGGFEAYLTPVGEGELNVALLLERGMARRLKGDVAEGFWALVRGAGPLADALEGARPLSEPRLCGPLRQEATGVVADGALLVGDAAGFLDGITGEGMSLTLISAALGAATIEAGLRAGRVDQAALAPYAQARARAARDLLWLTELVLAGIRRPRLAAWVVQRLDRHPELFERVLGVGAGVNGLTAVLRPG